MKAWMRMASFCLAMCLSCATAQAQEPGDGALELRAGETVKGAVGKPGQIDYYHFVGEAGSRQGFKVASKSRVEMMLFDPEGNWLLSTNHPAKGDDLSKADSREIVLPWTDGYLLAVLRTDPSQSYALVMTATEPTPTEAFLARGVGYTKAMPDGARISTCWIVPGVEQFTSTSTRAFTTHVKLLPDRNFYTQTTRLSDGSLFGNANKILRVWVEGSELLLSEPNASEEYVFHMPLTVDLFQMAAARTNGATLQVTYNRCR